LQRYLVEEGNREHEYARQEHQYHWRNKGKLNERLPRFAAAKLGAKPAIGAPGFGAGSLQRRGTAKNAQPRDGPPVQIAKHFHRSSPNSIQLTFSVQLTF
jgi:hypothetical protein